MFSRGRRHADLHAETLTDHHHLRLLSHRKDHDLDFGGEYVNFRMDTSAGYSAGIRQNEAYPVTRMKPDSEGRPVTLNTTQDPKPVSAGDL